MIHNDAKESNLHGCNALTGIRMCHGGQAPHANSRILSLWHPWDWTLVGHMETGLEVHMLLHKTESMLSIMDRVSALSALCRAPTQSPPMRPGTPAHASVCGIGLGQRNKCRKEQLAQSVEPLSCPSQATTESHHSNAPVHCQSYLITAHSHAWPWQYWGPPYGAGVTTPTRHRQPAALPNRCGKVAARLQAMPCTPNQQTMHVLLAACAWAVSHA